MNDWTRHPSYDPNAGKSLEQDLSVAIQQSIALGGQSVGVAYSESAVDMLREWCEWESEDTYSFRGGDGDREWRVHLLERVAPRQSERTADAWWRWHDADSSRWSPGEDPDQATADAESRCAAWVAGDSDDGPDQVD